MGSHSFKKLPSRGWFLVHALVLPAMAFGQQSAAWVAQVSQQGSAFRVRLKAAAQLYEELEYEQALKSINRAKSLATTDDERAEASIYEGIVLADLGKRQLSLKAFSEALALRPASLLPVKVSPKVERDFEDVRAKVQSEAQASLAPESPSVRASTEDSPRLPDSEKSAVDPQTPVSPEPSLLAGHQDAAWSQEPPGLRVRPLPLAMLGAGVMAGGVGTYFGLRSRSHIQNARDAIYPDEQLSHLDSARGPALGANILFGIAATAAVGAVITHFLTDEDANP